MKLNHDNVRSLLLFVESKEENSSRSEAELMEFATQNEISKNELIYIIQRLTDAEFITSSIQYASNQVYWFSINTITWDGHSYLDNIRDPKVWKNAKSVASKIASVSLPIMGEIAKVQLMKLLGIEGS